MTLKQNNKLMNKDQQMQIVNTLLLPKWIIPVEPTNTYLADHAIAINSGRIIDLLSASEAKRKYQAIETIDLPSHVVMPGLINTHTHSAMALLRGIADDLPFMEWLTQHIQPAEATFTDEQFVIDGTKLSMAEMLKSGTTTCNDHYFFLEAFTETTLEIGMRAVAGFWLADVPTKWGKDFDDYMRRGLNFYKHNKDKIAISFAPHSPYLLIDESLIKLKEAADELPINIHMHVAESKQELKDSLSQHGKTPVKRLHDLGLLSPRFQAAHMVQLNTDDIALTSQAGVHIASCPKSNYKLASGFANVQRYIENGINVALATDSATSNNSLDMFEEMKMTALVNKALNDDPTATPAAECIRMATLNGAKLLGMENEIGSIEIGKQADLIALDLDHPATQPVLNPISQIAYACSREQVSDVWVSGNRLVNNKELTTIDEKSVIATAKKWQKKLLNH